MKKKSMNATTLQYILIGLLLVMIVGAVASFTYLNSLLEQREHVAGRAQIDAEVEQNTLATLQVLETELEQESATVERAASIVADSREYQYQDQIVEDINTYAQRAGVHVTGYNFESTEGEPVAGTDGLFAMEANLTLNTPVPYENFLRFLKYIEQNLTKMQITGVSLSPDPADPNKVSNPTVGLQIFVRGSN